MNRRRFLTWTGLQCVAASLAITTESLFSKYPAIAQTRPMPRRNRQNTFYTRGRYLYDRLGNKVILRGVNKMSVWDHSDPTGSTYFPEIRKTGANSVRIVWLIKDDNGNPTNLNTLNSLITNARRNQLIPMIELHDATGNWSRLQELVNYWTQPAVVALIQRHQEYLLVNIGNEVGDDQVSPSQFISGYTGAITAIRSAGIQVPLVIDASEWGKNLTMLNETASTLLNADPNKNLLFSVHLYWPKFGGADANFIRSNLQNSVDLGYPLIVGEFSKFGAWAGKDVSVCSSAGEVDYQTILEECQRHEIGWYAWEWGPGNIGCAAMDMTPDGLFNNIKDGWAKEVAISSPYSIKNTSITPPTMTL